MKRNYLNVPGQVASISIRGAQGIGKTALVEKFAELLSKEGLEVTVHPGEFVRGAYVESLSARCMTTRESRDKYLESLGQHEIDTLRGHLDALGYEL